MPLYAASVSVTNPGVSKDVLNLTGNSYVGIKEVYLSGIGTNWSPAELDVSRCLSGGLGSTSQVPEKLDPLSQASQSLVTISWFTEPTVSNTKLLRLGINSSRGVYRWVAKKNEQIAVDNFIDGISQVSFRFSSVGVESYKVGIIFEER